METKEHKPIGALPLVVCLVIVLELLGLSYFFSTAGRSSANSKVTCNNGVQYASETAQPVLDQDGMNVLCDNDKPTK